MLFRSEYEGVLAQRNCKLRITDGNRYYIYIKVKFLWKQKQPVVWVRNVFKIVRLKFLNLEQ